jgi:protease-4
MSRGLVWIIVLPLCGCFNGLILKPAIVDGPVDEKQVAPACGFLCFDKVALIDVDGLIVNARTGNLFSSGDNPVSLFRERLDAAACDRRVKAVVLRINTPGGGVTASDIMYRDLVNFREETGKPVVACLMDVAASGGYYLAVGCDRIFAHPTTVTGSIGVIMNLYNAHGLLSMVGVKSEPIKSGPNKDIGNPARPMSDAERALLQKMVNSFHEQFVSVVAKGRNLPVERVRELADGRVYTGLEAKAEGLVDEVGYLEDALNAALAMACLKDAKVVAYDSCSAGYRGSIYAAVPHFPSEVNVKLDLGGLGGLAGMEGGFYYLWEAGLRRR